MSSLMNKVKDALHSDNKSSQPEGTHGPHSSRVGNAADPRIDSDRDHREAYGTHGTHGTTGTTGTHGTHGTHGTTSTLGAHDGSYTTGDNYSYGTGQTAGRTGGPADRTDGPHSSNLANKMDPRVDSDRDHSGNMGFNPQGTATTGDTTGYGSTGYGSTGHGTTGTASRTTGPHSSSTANKMDPRVNSDRDHSRNMGFNQSGTSNTGTGTGTGTGGGAFFTGGSTGATTHGTTHGTTTHSTTGTRGSSGVPEGTFGQHSTRGNDSHLGSTTQGGYGTSGTAGGVGGGIHSSIGPAPHTAGPHKSDMLNKVDPRVDSDLDGSKTLGGNNTYSQSGEGRTTAKDPTDAAQVPPSVLQKHIGQPTIHHDDTTHDRERRHSVSHQEQHRGL